MERWLADLAFVSLLAIVIWDVLVFLQLIPGHSITHEIRGSWRSWPMFLLVGSIAGGHFLAGK
jgi:hypothetical protein